MKPAARLNTAPPTVEGQTMDFVNCLVALGGDRGNSVPKTRVTAAEIAVLQAIHGEDAVFEIEYIGDEDALELPKISRRAELERLKNRYAARNEDNLLIVEKVYPGDAARIFERLDDLNLDSSLMKSAPSKEIDDTPPAVRASAKAKPKAVASVMD
jgi:hypothetical protein